MANISIVIATIIEITVLSHTISRRFRARVKSRRGIGVRMSEKAVTSCNKGIEIKLVSEHTITSLNRVLVRYVIISKAA